MSLKSSRTTKPLADRIGALRKRIAALQAERRDILAQKRTRAEVVEIVDHLLLRWSTHGAADLTRELQRLAAGGPPEFLRVKGSAVVTAAPGAAPFSLDLAPLLISIIGPEVARAALLANLHLIPEGLGAAERRTRLDEIEAELLAAEADEEGLIVESELTDAPVARRVDARPEVVLAVEQPA